MHNIIMCEHGVFSSSIAKNIHNSEHVLHAS